MVDTELREGIKKNIQTQAMEESFNVQRMQTRYIGLREKIVYYALENCITNVQKTGLSETEIECIKNRSYTFIQTYKDFNTYQKLNFFEH